MEPAVAGEALEALGLFRFSSLTGWTRWDGFSGILLAAAPAVQRNDFLLADGRFAHRACIPVPIHPLVYTRPTEQVPAHTDHRILGRVQTDVTLEHRVVLFLLAVFRDIFEVDFGFATARSRTAAIR